MPDHIQPVPDPQPKRRKRRRWLLYLLIVLVVLAILIGFLLTQTHLLDGLKRSLRYLGEDSTDPIVFDSFGTSVYAQADNTLAVAMSGGVAIYDIGGEQLGRIQKNLQSPVLCGAGDRFLCYDVGGSFYAVLDAKGNTCFEKTSEQTIFDADLSTEGYSALLTAGAEGRSELQVFDPSGALLYRRNSKTHYLSGCAVSPDGGHAVAVALGQQDIHFTVTAQIYPTDSEEMAAELVLGDQIPYDISFLDDQAVCAVTAQQALFFDLDGTLTGTYSIENGQITGYSFGGDGFVTLLLDLYQTGERFQLVTLSRDGTVWGSFSTDDVPLWISACGAYTALLTAQGLRIYDSGLELSSSAAQDGAASCVLVREDGTAWLVQSGEAKLYIP